MNKKKLKDAVRELRKVYHDAIAERVQQTTKSYAEIGAELGCSEQLVYQVARLRGLCRTAPKGLNSTEVGHE